MQNTTSHSITNSPTIFTKNYKRDQKAKQGRKLFISRIKEFTLNSFASRSERELSYQEIISRL